MNRKHFLLIGTALVLSTVSCGKTSNSTDAEISNDSIAVEAGAPDSVAAVVEEVVEEANPESDLALTIENKNLRYAEESSAKTGTWTVKVTNNGKTAIKGSEYVVAYDELLEVFDDGEFRDVTAKRTVEGQDVAPGESVLIVLKAQEGCQDFKSPKIQNKK